MTVRANNENFACPSWVLGAFGTFSVVVGLFASAVATWFFTLGLQATEADQSSRDALIAAGVLLTLCQLIAFGSTALLPSALLRRQRWKVKALGALLFGFEVLTMAITQLALVQVADAQARAQGSRAMQLRTAIESRRATAAGLRANAETQSRSLLAPSREAGAAALRQALAIDADIDRLASELAQVEGATRPTLTSLLGPDKTTWYVVARSALVALAGLVMVSWGGSLFSEARRAATTSRPAALEFDGESKVAEAAVHSLPSAPQPISGADAGPAPTAGISVSAPPLALPTAGTVAPGEWAEQGTVGTVPGAESVALIVAASPAPQHAKEKDGDAAPVRPAAVVLHSSTDSARAPAASLTAAAAATQGSLAARLAYPLAAQYPVVFFDGLQVKVFEAADVRAKAAYVAIGARSGAALEPLGIWVEHTTGTAFWLGVFTSLKVRGVESMLIAVADDFTGVTAALRHVFPTTTAQGYIVQLIRDSLDYANPKDRGPLARALRPIYRASCAELAAAELDDFENGQWGRRYPAVVACWRRAWDRVTPFFAFAPDVRRLVYATSAIEDLHERLARAANAQGIFPSADAAAESIWEVLQDRAASAGAAAP